MFLRKFSTFFTFITMRKKAAPFPGAAVVVR